MAGGGLEHGTAAFGDHFAAAARRAVFRLAIKLVVADQLLCQEHVEWNSDCDVVDESYP